MVPEKEQEHATTMYSLLYTKPTRSVEKKKAWQDATMDLEIDACDNACKVCQLNLRAPLVVPLYP